MSIESLFVFGAGQMGAGIAQVAAASDISVTLYDKFDLQLDKAKKSIEFSLAKHLEKGQIDKAKLDKTLSLVTFTASLPSAIKADLVIEAAVEDMEIKKEIFKTLSELVTPATILATNTSSLSITKIASVTKNPEQVIGMHFMNPVPLMALVEIIRGIQTSDSTFQAVADCTKKLGKTVVEAKKDFPGFIVNRILVPMINEAFFVLMEGIASPEDIDEAMKLGTNQPMGPLKLADLVGLDTCLFICEIFHKELGEDKYRPCPLLRKYVEAGWLGRKTKKGVYTY